MALILLGKSASGKDTIRKKLKNLGMRSVISYTTRPARLNEIDGVDYHFITNEQFTDMQLFGVREYKVASGDVWRYGFKLEDLDANSVLIIDPIGFRELKDVKDLPIVSFYIKVADDILRLRAIQRGDNIEEIERRAKADNHDFFFIEPRVNFSINNSQGDVHVIAKCIYDLYQNYIRG